MDATAEALPIAKPVLLDIYTAPNQAVKEMEKRRGDRALLEKVRAYLGDAIPDHFQENGPILYLARHIATPNLETLRFIELAEPYGLPIVIGEDLNDKFVSNNSLKRSLCKMSVSKGTAKNGKEILESFTIVDFDTAQGKSLRDIETMFGEPLSVFHRRLFDCIHPKNIRIVDESAWVDPFRTEDLVEQYKKMFALFVVHGIMFEWYPMGESELLAETVIPAFKYVEEKLGARPLICELVPQELADTRDWESYPRVIHPLVSCAV